MDTKAVHRAIGLGWQIATQYGLDRDDCAQEAVAVALEVFRDAHVESSASPTLWARIHARLVGQRGSLRYTFPVGCDGPRVECRGCGEARRGSHSVSLGVEEQDTMRALCALHVNDAYYPTRAGCCS